MKHLVVALTPESAQNDAQEYHYQPEGTSVQVRASSLLVEEQKLTPPCPVCGCEHIYRQRDFNRNLGLTIVVCFAVAGLIASAVQGTILPLILFLILASVIDLAIYSFLPDVGVCYRCLTCFRNVTLEEPIQAYDQHVADAFEFPAEAAISPKKEYARNRDIRVPYGGEVFLRVCSQAVTLPAQRPLRDEPSKYARWQEFRI